MRRIFPLALVLLCPLFPGPAFGGAPIFWRSVLPVVPPMRSLAGGAMRVNMTDGRWAVYTGGDAGDCRREAKRLGWRVTDEFLASLPSSTGGVTLAGYGRERDSRMLVMVLPESGPGPVVMVLLDRPVRFADGTGEAPGRDPAGVSRVGSGRRLLHLVGDRFEGAFYSSPAGPGAVLSSARSMLASRGWKTREGGAGILLASRSGSPDLAYFAGESGEGSRYLVFVSRRNK